jgi:hypothetical protein
MLVLGGFALTVLGAVVTFAWQPGQALNWKALGLILLISGLAVLLAEGAAQAFSAAASTSPTQTGQSKTSPAGYGSHTGGTRSGLVAVLSGIFAVTVLGVVTLALLRAGADADNTSTVAIATSAFGVISAVVGAYLGIKIGAEQGQAATKAVGDVQMARDARTARQGKDHG